MSQQRSIDSWFDVAAGDLIYHDSWQLCATMMADVPRLTFLAWLQGEAKRWYRDLNP